jgi:AbrB family looped-hinge helix DNA binding protein
MNVQTKLSAKGQVVIPKDVRDRMGLAIGEAFDVIERGNEVILRRSSLLAGERRLSVAEASAILRKIVKYDGPRISDEEISNAAIEMAAEKYDQLRQKG